MEFKNKELEKFEKKLESQKVAVIGLGVSNIPLIDYLHSKNADVSVFDDREEEKINKEIIEKIKNITMNPTTPNTISANSIAPVLVTF